MQGSVDISERLADAVRIEVAQRFFGARKDLEDQIHAFHEYVAALKERHGRVADWAKLLRFVTLSDEIHERFWEMVGVPKDLFQDAGDFPRELLPQKIPHGLTVSGSLSKIWQWAYGAIETAVRIYTHGEPTTKAVADVEDPLSEDLSYSCLLRMCQWVNEEVQRINTDLSANHTLEFMKNLDVERAGNECRIGGIGTLRAGDLDQRLAFCPIDFESLHLPHYPDLPTPKSIRNRMVQLARETVSTHREAVRAMIKALNQKARGASPV